MSITTDYISIARELTGLGRRLQDELPCHVNLVDAIGADENANSRILAGILSCRDETGNYDVLKAFARHFFGGTGLEAMIGKPTVVTEQPVRGDWRIDIYIHEPGKYAIILENKVMDAPEQPRQLANYIEGLNDMGFANEQIFIGYLPRTSETRPSDSAWTGREGTCYRDEFLPRFSIISFRDAILPWLKSSEFPSGCTAMLQQGVAIYADYLDGLFGFRPNEHYIEMRIDDFIADKLAYTNRPADDLQKATEAIAEIDALKKEIVRRKREDARTILNEWWEKAKSALPGQAWEECIADVQFPSIGFTVSHGGHQRAFRIFIQIDHHHHLVYYGAHVGKGCTMPVAEAREVLKPIMDGIDKFVYAVGIKMFTARTTAHEGYDKFITLAKAVVMAFQ